jgi:hypothetical protein
LGLTIDAFEMMTPAEFEWRRRGQAQEERRALLRTAQLACWVMSPFLKNPITVGDLVALRPEERPRIDTSGWV